MGEEKKPLSWIFDKGLIIYIYTFAVVVLYTMGIMFYMIIGPYIRPDQYLENAIKSCEYIVPLVFIKMFVGAGLIWLSFLEVSLFFILDAIKMVLDYRKLVTSKDESQ